MDTFPFLHLLSLPTSLNSPPSCLRTCFKSHDTLVHNPLATFLNTHHKILSIIYKAVHDLALTPVLTLSHDLSATLTFLAFSWHSFSTPSLLSLAVSCAWTSLPSDHHQFDSFLQLDFRSNVLPSRKTSLTLTSISKTTSLISPVILYHIILVITLHSSYHTCDTFLSLLSLLSPLPFWMWAPQELYPQQLNYD